MGKDSYIAWIGTNSVRNSRGIYCLHIDKKTLKPTIVSTKQAYNTGALSISKDGKKLFAVSEGMSFDGCASGGAMSYNINEDGQLTYVSGITTLGQRPCAIAYDDELSVLYTANFYGGSIAKIEVTKQNELVNNEIFVQDKKPDNWLHAMHCVGLMNKKNQLGVVSVSQSQFAVYNTNSAECLATFNCSGKIFPRYFICVEQYVYFLLQDPGKIFVLKNCIDEGNGLVKIQEIDLQADKNGFSASSVIRATPNGELIFAASRKTDTITVYKRNIDDGTLFKSDVIKLPGLTPRDFNISPDGKILIAVLQRSDKVCTYKIDLKQGTLVLMNSDLEIPSPASVVIRKDDE